MALFKINFLVFLHNKTKQYNRNTVNLIHLNG